MPHSDLDLADILTNDQELFGLESDSDLAIEAPLTKRRQSAAIENRKQMHN